MRYFSWPKPECGLLMPWLPATVLLLGVLSGGGFWWLNHLNSHYQQFDRLLEVIYEVDRQVAHSHLSLDDQLGCDPKLVRHLLGEATHAVADLRQRLQEDWCLDGKDGKQRELLAGVSVISETLLDLQKITVELEGATSKKKAVEQKIRFDNKFQFFSHTALQVEGIMKDIGSAHIRYSLSVFRAIFAGWVLFVVMLVAALLRVESKRLSTARALADSEEMFRTMTESARDAIVLADKQGVISYWNKAAERMFGRSGDELKGAKLCDILQLPTLGTEDRNRCETLWQMDAEGGDDAAIVEGRVDSGAGVHQVEVSVAPITLHGRPQNIAILRDIKERKRAEQALRENEALLRTLINAMPDFVCFKDGAGRWLLANEFGLRLFGIENVAYQHKSDAELAEHKEFYKQAFYACIKSDEEAWRLGVVSRCDEIIPRMEGAPFIYDVIKVPLFNDDRSRKGLLVIGRDITERKTIEKALLDSQEKLRHLSASLFVVQETERRRIANELHDELGQALAALKMQIRAMQRRLAGERPVEVAECDEICVYIKQIIENVRRLSRDLSPVVLDDLGLRTAIRRMLDKFSELHDMDVAVTMDDIGHLLDPSAERIVYRIVQEALTNIAKHAHARHLEVSIRRQERDIRFLIRDDGCGFDPEAEARKKATERGLGLTAMSERVRMLGGVLDIVSAPGHGTSISLSIPVCGG
ncbi:MAG: PAS domain S-box protein [Desulfobulbaceae bacterium]|nr:PAS domain S-box protein [Desulfobulbaceae bacterium]